MTTIDQIINLPDDDVVKILTNNNVTSISPLDDRLNVIIITHNNGSLTPQDSLIVRDPDFQNIYRMEHEDLVEMAQLYDILTNKRTFASKITRIDIIRAILEVKLFEITIMGPHDIIYHGTHYKLIGDVPFAPGYFSRDVLQSLGHIMRDFKEFSDAYKNFNKPVLNKKIDAFTCFPSIYCYRFVQNTNLLILKHPHIHRTFSKLFIPEILVRYVEERSNKEEIAKQFIEKMVGALQMRQAFIQSKPLVKIIEIYLTRCLDSCFGGWTNTPGYFLLQSIDYNRYLTEIGIITPGTQIDGLYISQDQDEIVLFGTINSLIQYLFRSYMLPYKYISENLTVAAQFIENYIRNIGDYKRSRLGDNLVDIAQISQEYNMVNDKEWNFSWFLTDVTNYDPYSTQEEAGYQYKIDINNVEQRFEHRLTTRSSKISIENISLLKPNLRMLIDTILNKWRSDNFEGVDQLCENVMPATRTFIPQFV
ncbi:Hypothetical protein HVR_LOCUS1059 [uncultured virus]|nr:Hypothetical protein HVR_LOCUS1059 [uncultured virus]